MGVCVTVAAPCCGCAGGGSCACAIPGACVCGVEATAVESLGSDELSCGCNSFLHENKTVIERNRSSRVVFIIGDLFVSPEQKRTGKSKYKVFWPESNSSNYFNAMHKKTTGNPMVLIYCKRQLFGIAHCPYFVVVFLEPAFLHTDYFCVLAAHFIDVMLENVFISFKRNIFAIFT